MPAVAATILFLLVAGIAATTLRKGAAVSGLSDQCRDIQRRIAALGEGSSPIERDQLQALLRQCASDLAAAGVEVDLSAIELGNALETARNLDIEWSAYLATSYDDIIKRTSKRNNIMRLQDTMARNLMDAATAASTDGQRAAVRDVLQTQIVNSLMRAHCVQTGGSGCGRYGVNEPDWDERASQELQHGAFALGLRTAVNNGWGSPMDRGPRSAPRDAAAWQAYERAAPGGNIAPADLYRVGELARLITPSWDDFGGGPHYPGQFTVLIDTWRAQGATPYDHVRLFQATDLARAMGRRLRVGGFRLGA